MSRTERSRSLRFTQGPTALFATREGARIVSRGSTIDFNTLEDLTQFTEELNIIMVELSQKREELMTNTSDQERTETGQS